MCVLFPPRSCLQVNQQLTLADQDSQSFKLWADPGAQGVPTYMSILMYTSFGINGTRFSSLASAFFFSLFLPPTVVTSISCVCVYVLNFSSLFPPHPILSGTLVLMGAGGFGCAVPTTVAEFGL